ncbi:TniB family NTP-binding protein [Chryseotalea sanaruensis]|nr:TniB family NTP-binding protein [Chryseotalea sanaruensis]
MVKEYLSNTTRDFLASCEKMPNSTETRIKFIQKDGWIGYELAKKILDRVKEMVERPRNSRMHSLLVIGSTDNGKTSIRKRIEEIYKRYPDDKGRVIWPVVSIQMPPNPTELSFINAIIKGMLQPCYYGKPHMALEEAIELLISHKVRLLMIDEVHHIIRLTPAKQRIIMDLIKFISNEAELPFVAFGTEEATNIFSYDPQLKNRFKKMEIPRWQADSNFLRLMFSFISVLPLKQPSLLTTNPKAPDAADIELAEAILDKTNGTIGEISMVIRNSAIVAIRDKEEKITKKIVLELEFESSETPVM